MSVVEDTLGWRGLGTSHPDVQPSSFCSLPLWNGVSSSIGVLKKGFAKSTRMFCAWKIKTTRRGSNFHTRTACCCQPSGGSPCPSGLLSKPTAQPGLAPHQASWAGDKRCVSTAQNDHIHPVSNGFYGTFGYSVQGFFLLKSFQ